MSSTFIVEIRNILRKFVLVCIIFFNSKATEIMGEGITSDCDNTEYLFIQAGELRIYVCQSRF